MTNILVCDCKWGDCEWAYLAGLIDGDGCITIRRRDRGKTVGDRGRGISFELKVMIGGETNHLTKLKNEMGFGTIYIRKPLGQRHLAEWRIAGNQAIYILNKIKPFIRLKVSQCEVALSMPRPITRWMATPEMRRRQDICRVEVSKLNQLGRGKKEVKKWESNEEAAVIVV